MAGNRTNLLRTVGEICDRFGMSENLFYQLRKLGLPARQINGQWLAHAEVIDDWLKWLCNPSASGGPQNIRPEDGGDPMGGRNPRAGKRPARRP